MISLVSNATTCGQRVAAQYHCSSDGCATEMPGKINYVMLGRCLIDHNEEATMAWSVIGYTVLTILFLLMLYLLEAVTDKYFCASIKLVVKSLHLSPSVAGVTFLAVGNGASDVFSSVAAFSSGSSEVGVGTLLGAGLFVALVVVGTVALLTDDGIKLQKLAFVREVSFLVVSTGYLWWALADGKVGWGETIGFFVLYALFVLVVLVGSKTSGRRTKTAQEPASTSTLVDGSFPKSPSYGTPTRPLPRDRSRSDGLAALERQSSRTRLHVKEQEYPGDQSPARSRRERSWSDSTVDILLDLVDEDTRLPALGKGTDWTLSFLQVVQSKDAPIHEFDRSLTAGAGGAGPSAAEGDPMTPSKPPPDSEVVPIRPTGNFSSNAIQREQSVINLAVRVPAARLTHFAALQLPQAFSKFRLGVLRPIMSVVKLPFVVAQNLTIPQLEYHSYDWRLAAITPTAAIQFIGWYSNEKFMQRALIPAWGGMSQAWVLGLVIGSLVSMYVVAAAPRSRPPAPTPDFGSERRKSMAAIDGESLEDLLEVSWSEFLLFYGLAGLSFVTSIVWIIAIANELVGIAVAFGLFLGLSESMVGLTILAIGNSFQDWAADVTIARRGYPSMAVAGAYAGPIFNILLGLGVPLLVSLLSDGTVSLGTDNTTTFISFATLMFGLLFTAIAVPMNNFVITRRVGVAMIVIYCVYLVLVVTLQVLEEEGDNP